MVLYTCPFRKNLEHILSHKYAVQSPISLGSDYMPYVFLRRVEFPIWPYKLLLQINKLLVHIWLFKKCQCWKVIIGVAKVPFKYNIFFKKVLLGKKIQIIIHLLRSVKNLVMFNFLLRPINPNIGIIEINFNLWLS